MGWDIKTRLDVALKLEPVKTKNPHLRNKHAVYKALSNAPGFPTMHWDGTEASYNVMVLDHLSLTLEKAISKSHDDNLVFYLANQMVFFFLFRYVLKCLIHIPLVTLSTAFMS